jgi:exosortase A-associated hydrolase 2
LSANAITAEFVVGSRARIFALAHHPQGFEGRCVLIAPPFAEEMNKSRRMMTELAHRLNARGIGVIVPDYFGTGDSEGEFADTNCSIWLDDLAAVEAWAVDKGWSVDAVLGIRFGCAVAAEFARRRPAAFKRMVFWQPTLDGARVLEQFLRLRVAASLMEDKKETVAELKSKFGAGEVVEVAGYDISPALAEQMERYKLLAILDDLPLRPSELHWFEVVRSAEAAIPMPSQKATDQLRAQSWPIAMHTCVGEPFWTSTEIVCVPELLDATANALTGQSP